MSQLKSRNTKLQKKETTSTLDSAPCPESIEEAFPRRDWQLGSTRSSKRSWPCGRNPMAQFCVLRCVPWHYIFSLPPGPSSIEHLTKLWNVFWRVCCTCSHVLVHRQLFLQKNVPSFLSLESPKRCQSSRREMAASQPFEGHNPPQTQHSQGIV